MSLIQKINQLNLPIINFLDSRLELNNSFYFENFSLEVFELMKSLKSSQIIILDKAYSLSLNQKSQFFAVQDHINLSSENPFIGLIPPQFFAVNNLYKISDFPELPLSITVGVNHNCMMTKEESQVLQNTKADSYCYNLIPSSLTAAFAQKGVIALIQIQNTNSIN